MPTNIMPTPPLPPDRLTSLPRHKLLRAPRPLHLARQQTRTPRNPEPAIHESGPEKPLRHGAPPQRHEPPPQRPAEPFRRQHETAAAARPRRRVQQKVQEERHRHPEPGDLDEEDVEDVALAREVARRRGRRVRLRGRVVGRLPRGGVQEGEEGAEQERAGVDG